MAGGQADAAAQDSFCKGTSCVITKIHDQSPHGNLVEYQGKGTTVGGVANPAVAFPRRRPRSAMIDRDPAWNPERTPPGLFARLAVDGRAAWTGKIVLEK